MSLLPGTMPELQLAAVAQAVLVEPVQSIVAVQDKVIVVEELPYGL